MAPLQITSRSFPLTDSIRSFIQGYAAKLETFYKRTIRCHVTISTPHRHQRKGKVFHVSILLELPGQDLSVSRESEADASHESLRRAIHDAFKALDRQLEDRVRRMRGYVKKLAGTPLGVVTRFIPEMDCGFLETSDGQEIYFHKNSLKRGQFARLREGSEVSFRIEDGEKGPQASFVRMLHNGRNCPEAA